MNESFGANASSRAVWLVVNTHSNREVLAERNLIRQGFEVYGPVIQKQIRHARRVHDVLRPLFPGYLFVRRDSRELRWRPILSTLGVRSVVCNGEEPSLLHGSLIADLKARERDGIIARSASPLKVGHTVRVARGPFDGLVGKIIELCEKDRLIVLMDFLNQPIKVTVTQDLLSIC